MAITGNGTTLTFGTSGFTADIISIDGSEASLPELDVSHLGTTGNVRKMVGDLVDQGSFSFEFFLDSEEGGPPLDRVTETVTITFPDDNTFAGSAFTTKFKFTGIENNNLIRGSATVTWTGASGPAFG